MGRLTLAAAALCVAAGLVAAVAPAGERQSVLRFEAARVEAEAGLDAELEAGKKGFVKADVLDLGKKDAKWVKRRVHLNPQDTGHLTIKTYVPGIILDGLAVQEDFSLVGMKLMECTTKSEPATCDKDFCLCLYKVDKDSKVSGYALAFPDVKKYRFHFSYILWHMFDDTSDETANAMKLALTWARTMPPKTGKAMGCILAEVARGMTFYDNVAGYLAAKAGAASKAEAVQLLKSPLLEGLQAQLDSGKKKGAACNVQFSALRDAVDAIPLGDAANPTVDNAGVCNALYSALGGGGVGGGSVNGGGNDCEANLPSDKVKALKAHCASKAQGAVLGPGVQAYDDSVTHMTGIANELFVLLFDIGGKAQRVTVLKSMPELIKTCAWPTKATE